MNVNAHTHAQTVFLGVPLLTNDTQRLLELNLQSPGMHPLVQHTRTTDITGCCFHHSTPVVWKSFPGTVSESPALRVLSLGLKLTYFTWLTTEDSNNLTYDTNTYEVRTVKHYFFATS